MREKKLVRINIYTPPRRLYDCVLILLKICIDKLEKITSSEIKDPPLILFIDDLRFQNIKKSKDDIEDKTTCRRRDPNIFYSKEDNILFIFIDRLEKEKFENYLWFPFFHVFLHELLHIYEKEADTPPFNSKNIKFEFDCDHTLVFDLIEDILDSLGIKASYRNFMRTLTRRNGVLEEYLEIVESFTSKLIDEIEHSEVFIEKMHFRSREKYIFID